MLIKLFKFSTNKYSSVDHSLLKQIYTYPYYEHYLGYILLDHKTRSIIVVDPGDYQIAMHNVAILRAENNYNFTHILQTHGNSKHTFSSVQLANKFDGLKVYAGDAGHDTTSYYTNLANDLQPFTIGELSVCFIKAPGHRKDNFIIAFTHVSETSTRVPILFTGDTIQCCSIGEVEDFNAFNQTIFRLRGFPNDSLIFPGHKLRQENLLLAKTLDPQNPAINIKLQVLAEALKTDPNPMMVPTSLMEERLTNPYLRNTDQELQKIVKETNLIKYLEKLKRIEKTFYSNY